jgi:hypothetical protein
MQASNSSTSNGLSRHSIDLSTSIGAMSRCAAVINTTTMIAKLAAQLCDQLGVIRTGDAQIQQDERRQMPGDLGWCVCAIRRGVEGIAFVGQNLIEEINARGLIVDEEDAAGMRCSVFLPVSFRPHTGMC